MPRPPGKWTETELQRDITRSIAHLVRKRSARMTTQEPADYAAHVAHLGPMVGRLLAATNDLTAINASTLADRQVMKAARYIVAPPISADDLDVLTGAGRQFSRWLKASTARVAAPTAAQFSAAATLIQAAIPPLYAPWLANGRAASPQERRRFESIVTAAYASARILAERKSQAAADQEQSVRDALAAARYVAVPGLSPAPRTSMLLDGKDPATGAPSDPVAVLTPPASPARGSYATAHRKLRGRDIDVPVRLRPNHSTGLVFLAINCKVTNTSLNSLKRLEDVKSRQPLWDSAAPARGTYATAVVISGALDLADLVSAQNQGIHIFWEHRLTDLTAFVRR